MELSAGFFTFAYDKNELISYIPIVAPLAWLCETWLQAFCGQHSKPFIYDFLWPSDHGV